MKAFRGIHLISHLSSMDDKAKKEETVLIIEILTQGPILLPIAVFVRNDATMGSDTINSFKYCKPDWSGK